MCDDVPNFQRCDGYDAPLNTCPYALFDSSSNDPAPSPQLSSISSQVDLSGFDTLDESCADDLARERPPNEVPLFTNPFSSPTAPAPVVCWQPLPVPPMDVNWKSHPLTLLSKSLRSASPLPNYHPPQSSPVQYPATGTWYPHHQTTSTMFGCLLSTMEDIALDRVLELLHHTRSVDSESVAGSIERLLSDLTVNMTALQYRLVLELALLLMPEECRSFPAGSTVGEKHDDVAIKIKESTPDPWSMEPLEFTADDGYSKKRDASFSETAKFLSETTSFATSTFHWHSFLDAAAWNKADHALHNAINSTASLLPATFHPVVVDGMLCLYLAG
ncbi:hypothetical protein PISMIDRAFT_16673 [Pisolithus microcarpus 441]|uniref:Uncharacterized protein n=1 Tax=Pisolithus microcarpus 441 TaxID=765257 RepID=A0A0C9XSB0_9AGAM|nr:hypothetical protein PISMIDRAFT_16673 [Pisolithus microcarpus 441]